MTLYLLPNMLSFDALASRSFVPAVQEAVLEIEGLFCEDPKEARRFLSYFKLAEGKKIQDIPILSVKKEDKEVESILACLFKEGKKWGLVTDCGLPCLADPGSELVRQARQKGLQIVTFPGPSSIVMALQLSGIYCQRFSFEGYLPHGLTVRQIQELERESIKKDQAIIFIETPYRSQGLLQLLVSALSPSTDLCIASGLTSLDGELVLSQEVGKWRELPFIDLQKKPTIFLFKGRF